MPKSNPTFGVLCDTSFLVCLNRPIELLHGHARGYLKYLMAEQAPLYVSSIALAEYAVRDVIANLPMRYLRVLPFNIDHAQRAGEFARIAFSKRDQLPSDPMQRVIIPNDTKMFAQADVTQTITHYLTGDQKCEKVDRLIRSETPVGFQILSLTVPHHQAFGELDLDN